MRGTQGTRSAGHEECRARRARGVQGTQGTRSAGHAGYEVCRARGVQGTRSAGHEECRARRAVSKVAEPVKEKSLTT